MYIAPVRLIPSRTAVYSANRTSQMTTGSHGPALPNAAPRFGGFWFTVFLIEAGIETVAAIGEGLGKRAARKAAERQEAERKAAEDKEAQNWLANATKAAAPAEDPPSITSVKTQPEPKPFWRRFLPFQK